MNKRIKNAFGETEADAQQVERMWHLTQSVDDLGPEFTKTSASRRKRTVRIAIVAACSLAVLGGAAFAAESTGVTNFFDESTPPRDRMEVFRDVISPQASGVTDPDTPRAEAEIVKSLTSHWALEPELMTDEYGALVADDIRVLLDTDLLGNQFTMYAVPTSNGNVCIETTGLAAGSTCVPSFSVDTPVHYTLGSRGAVFIVRGVFADEVDGVKVQTTEGTVEDAALGINAFAWAGYEMPDELRISLRDGSSRTISLPAIPGASGAVPQ